MRSNTKIVKTKEPGPGSYRVPESLEHSAQLRKSVRNIFNKEKKITVISKSLCLRMAAFQTFT